MKKYILSIVLLGIYFSLHGQNKSTITIYADQPRNEISRHIYGHFAEHLGRCIYDGFWVDKSMPVEKQGRLRMDIIRALREIKIPNLRWPGGCFADEYQWRNGIGKHRPKTINSHWGGVSEDNSFGTHEFLELCELLGCEPYISANVGSGTPADMRDWIEYLTFSGESVLTRERASNGHPQPYKISFWGIGNENWGCGGDMIPQTYVEKYRQFQSYARNYSGNQLKKIACGPNGSDYSWMEECMRNIPLHMMWGISLHHYTIPTGNWENKGASTDFYEDQYFGAVKNCLYMDYLVKKHISIMDKYDPDNKVALVVDEWGIWTNPEPGSNPAFLYQQNTMRDAIIAASTLNIFNNYSHRIKMANLAQTVNVLQSLILTEREKMLLTPTYHVFNLFKVHQDAKLLPMRINSGMYGFDNESLYQINGSASKDASGRIHVSLVNIDPRNTVTTKLIVNGPAIRNIKVDLITSESYTDHNTFASPDNIVPVSNKNIKKIGNEIEIDLPPLSVNIIEIY